MFKSLKIFLCLIAVLALSGCGVPRSSRRTIVTTSFPCYDFVRAVIGDTTTFEVKMLLSPGQDMHDYDPTPQDQIALTESDLIVCVGGESESWMEDTINDVVHEANVIRLMDLVILKEEEIVEGMEADSDEEDAEYDEHVWTSPKNAITMVTAISESISAIDEDNQSVYRENAQHYCDAIATVDQKIQTIVANGARSTLYFGDRFPLRYFVDDYGLRYYAAFPGCSEQTEPSAKTLSQLIDRVKNDKVNVVFTIELSNGAIAKTIAEETGCTVRTFQTAHNIALDDFNAGKTYVDLMEENACVLKEALE